MTKGNVAIGEFMYELGCGVIEHDMEVFDSSNRLERAPVLEPDVLCREGELGSKWKL